MEILLNYKHIFYFVIGIFVLLFTWFIYKKYKLSKYQFLIFSLLTIFWCSVCIIRSYRKVYMVSGPEVGGLGFDELSAVSVIAAYGLISIFARLPIFALSDYFKTRKFFIALSAVFIFISSILVIIDPKYISLLSSSIAIGIGASLVSFFNVMFADTFSKDQAMVSVSVLSIAPLLAEFIVAPFQFYATNATVKDYRLLWIYSAVFALFALVMLIFTKDNKENARNFTWIKIKKVVTNYRFIIICLIGVVVSFIKFSTSGANMTTFVRMAEINMNALGVAYLDVIFTIFQLIAGVLVGLYLKNKIGIKNTLLLGLFFTLSFTLIGMFTINPIFLFLAYGLNGFGYGLTYNILIGLAMEPFSKDLREITMGVYQTFFAIGIYYGDKIYAFMFKMLNNITNAGIETYRAVFNVISITTVIAIVILFLLFKNKDMKELEN